MSKLLLLDTASMYYRAFHSMPETMVSKDGTPINAVRGLLERIIKLNIDRKPDLIIAAWDTEWRPQWRVDLIGSYKAHRVTAEVDEIDGEVDIEEVPDDLSPQVDMIMEILDAYGIATAGAAGFEGGSDPVARA